jgi:hypothetical protein
MRDSHETSKVGYGNLLVICSILDAHFEGMWQQVDAGA